jgi:hypothetical protein
MSGADNLCWEISLFSSVMSKNISETRFTPLAQWSSQYLLICVRFAVLLIQTLLIRIRIQLSTLILPADQFDTDLDPAV